MIARPERRNGPWMRSLDERLLEALHESGYGYPGQLRRDVSDKIGSATVQDRLRILGDAGLVATVGDLPSGPWEITTWGILYLRGDLDAQYCYPRRSYWPAVVSESIAAVG